MLLQYFLINCTLAVKRKFFFFSHFVFLQLNTQQVKSATFKPWQDQTPPFLDCAVMVLWTAAAKIETTLQKKKRRKVQHKLNSLQTIQSPDPAPSLPEIKRKKLNDVKRPHNNEYK